MKDTNQLDVKIIKGQGSERQKITTQNKYGDKNDKRNTKEQQKRQKKEFKDDMQRHTK